VLLGRDAEHARLEDLIGRARSGASAALVIRGEPGIGKSALLEHAVAGAQGVTLLQARGVESESELSFAGLADLVQPVVSDLDALPGPQRAALAGALALGPPVPGDRFTLYAATLSLLAAAAERGPVLAVVDDAAWLDLPSREALVFVARRLGEEGVVLLLAARNGESIGTEAARIDELVLEGLDATASATLLGGDVAPEVAARLFAATGGNPLALLELSSLLTAGQRTGAEPIEDPPPIGSTIAAAYAHRLDALPEPTRRALVVAAASESGATDEIVPALAALDVEPGALDAAETAGLVVIDGGRLTFRHPMLRSAAYRTVPAPERRAAHRALAAALAGERRAWHLATAAVAPDEAVAAELAAAAAAARGRGGPAGAIEAAERAARLTPCGWPGCRRRPRISPASVTSSAHGHCSTRRSSWRPIPAGVPTCSSSGR
jgi:predicted ATPase